MRGWRLRSRTAGSALSKGASPSRNRVVGRQPRSARGAVQVVAQGQRRQRRRVEEGGGEPSGPAVEAVHRARERAQVEQLAARDVAHRPADARRWVAARTASARSLAWTHCMATPAKGERSGRPGVLAQLGDELERPLRAGPVHGGRAQDRALEVVPAPEARHESLRGDLRPPVGDGRRARRAERVILGDGPRPRRRRGVHGGRAEQDEAPDARLGGGEEQVLSPLDLTRSSSAGDEPGSAPAAWTTTSAPRAAAASRSGAWRSPVTTSSALVAGQLAHGVGHGQHRDPGPLVQEPIEHRAARRAPSLR